MTAFYLGLASFLLLNLAAGMWRILRGPSEADRMLAAQLFGTTAVAILLLLAEAMGQPALRDVSFRPAGCGDRRCLRSPRLATGNRRAFQ